MLCSRICYALQYLTNYKSDPFFISIKDGYGFGLKFIVEYIKTYVFVVILYEFELDAKCVQCLILH